MEKYVYAQKLAALCIVFLGPTAVCDGPLAEESAAPLLTATGCGDNGTFETSLHGGIETAINWSSSEMNCDSMQRPDNQGIRLRFSGNAADERLAFIIALPELKAGEPALESPANVTLAIEDSGLFFSTPNLNSCWAEIKSQTALPDDNDSYNIRGTLFCIAPLGQVNGSGAVTVSDLSFTTVIEWSGT